MGDRQHAHLVENGLDGARSVSVLEKVEKPLEHQIAHGVGPAELVSVDIRLHRNGKYWVNGIELGVVGWFSTCLTTLAPASMPP